MRIVVDSSVIIADQRPTEPEHASAREALAALVAQVRAGGVSVFAPPELWLEVHVVRARLRGKERGKSMAEDSNGHRARGGAEGRGDPLVDLAPELVSPGNQEELAYFLEVLDKRMKGRRPFANATDLVYLWVGFRMDAAVITLDEGMLRYTGVVCDVMLPKHVRFR